MRLGHALVAAAASAGLLLSGCAQQPQPTAYATAAAADLQQTVLHVTKAAGDGKYTAARTRLDELEVETKVAHARGELTEARRDSILAAIALVRADLERLVAEAEAKAEAEAEQEAEEEAQHAAEEKAAEEARQAAEADAAAEQEAAEQAAQQDAADEDDGGGNGNGKGNGGNGGKGNGGKGGGNGKGKG